MSGLPGMPSAQGRIAAAWLQPVMLRLVDDFLILSPSRAAAEALVLRIIQGGHPILLKGLRRSLQGAT